MNIPFFKRKHPIPTGTYCHCSNHSCWNMGNVDFKIVCKIHKNIKLKISGGCVFKCKECLEAK